MRHLRLRQFAVGRGVIALPPSISPSIRIAKVIREPCSDTYTLQPQTMRLVQKDFVTFVSRIRIRNHKKNSPGTSLRNLQLLGLDEEKLGLDLGQAITQVPSLEHNGKVTGQSLDLLKWLILCGNRGLNAFDPTKKEVVDELLKYTDSFTKDGFTTLRKPESEVGQEVGPALDYLENALGNFDDGTFFLANLV
eukprot:Gb_32930 [translate_table: standard]